MTKPVAQWEEDDVLAMQGETDKLEKKGSKLLDPEAGADDGKVRDELAKQLSAFANTGGGQILYGIANDGTVDHGGISRTIRGRQSTKEWLEDVIPTLTDPEIVGFNVHEILPKPGQSSIGCNKAILVVDIPDSSRAPHQSSYDRRYYIRLGGKSHPASHRIIEDIRNRSRHPRLEVKSIVVDSADYIQQPGLLQLHLVVSVLNTSQIRAGNVCLGLSANVPLRCDFISRGQAVLRESKSRGIELLELVHTVYPEMGLIINPTVALPASLSKFMREPTAPTIAPSAIPLTHLASLQVGKHDVSRTILRTILYADSAPAHSQEFNLLDLDTKSAIANMIRSNS